MSRMHNDLKKSERMFSVFFGIVLTLSIACGIFVIWVVVMTLKHFGIV